ncbi:hypothetical protein [Dongshaea marina]|uniref:hypothetical protein n=1 Tax=Dongshaea marina TaxID=2047966 RepID=UPI00131ED7C0|nr:hypothetical protein [Dongshaea marina]
MKRLLILGVLLVSSAPVFAKPFYLFCQNTLNPRSRVSDTCIFSQGDNNQDVVKMNMTISCVKDGKTKGTESLEATNIPNRQEWVKLDTDESPCKEIDHFKLVLKLRGGGSVHLDSVKRSLNRTYFLARWSQNKRKWCWNVPGKSDCFPAGGG